MPAASPPPPRRLAVLLVPISVECGGWADPRPTVDTPARLTSTRHRELVVWRRTANCGASDRWQLWRPCPCVVFGIRVSSLVFVCRLWCPCVVFRVRVSSLVSMCRLSCRVSSWVSVCRLWCPCVIFGVSVSALAPVCRLVSLQTVQRRTCSARPRLSRTRDRCTGMYRNVPVCDVCVQSATAGRRDI